MAALPSRNMPTISRKMLTTMRKSAGVSRNVIIICASSCGMRSFVRIHANVDAAPMMIMIDAEVVTVSRMPVSTS